MCAGVIRPSIPSPQAALRRESGVDCISDVRKRYISCYDKNSVMKAKITDGEFRALAELRYRIRRFVQQGDIAARTAGLEPQQYLLLLAIRGLPQGQENTIRTLAERLALQHHSAVELINRMEQHGYVRRRRSQMDRRNVLVYLQRRGEKLLNCVARQRISEIRWDGRKLVETIRALLEGPWERSPKSGKILKQKKKV